MEMIFHNSSNYEKKYKSIIKTSKGESRGRGLSRGQTYCRKKKGVAIAPPIRTWPLIEREREREKANQEGKQVDGSSDCDYRSL